MVYCRETRNRRQYINEENGFAGRDRRHPAGVERMVSSAGSAVHFYSSYDLWVNRRNTTGLPATYSFNYHAAPTRRT